MLWNVELKCWTKMLSKMLSNVEKFKKKGCGMLWNVVQNVDECVGGYNVVKCDLNFML